MTLELVTIGAAATSLALALFVVAQRAPGLAQWTFALGMLGFALEAGATYALVAMTELPEDRVWWLTALTAIGLLVLVPWLAFCAAIAVPPVQRGRAHRWILVGGAAIPLVATAAAVVLRTAFQVSDIPGRFYAARLDWLGVWATVAQILGTVGTLAGLEAALRASTRMTRWRIKYLALGLGGIFLVRFYFQSHALLFHVVMASYLLAQAATLVLGSLVIAVALLRDRLATAQVAVSRQLVYRSVIVGVLGGYLLSVGVLGWAFDRIGLPESLFWGSLAVFVSALALAAVMLSEDVRWRIKRFVALHVYRSKYDYREQWSVFTKRLASIVTLEELAPQLLVAVTEAVGTTRALLYLADDTGGGLRLGAAVGVNGAPFTLGDADAVVVRSRALIPIFTTGSDIPAERSTLAGFPDVAVIVPLPWRGTLVGLVLVGTERTGARYGAEDLEFLATVAEQAAAAVVTARLSEKLSHARAFDAFHRLTSFVIHDLKNSIGALSLLSENALRHADDPEFQRDSLRTLSRTVERMKALLGKLSAPEARALRFQPVDLAAIVHEATRVVHRHPQIGLVIDAPAVPEVSGDPDALLRVLQNLVTNAVDALDGQGTLTIRVAADDDAAVVLTVADTGHGMSEEFLRKSLFAPFQTTKKGGWGIGLYQAKTVVEAHGGRIAAESRQGEGTTFTVRLPATSATARVERPSCER